MLLRHGASPFQVDNDGVSPLMYAASMDDKDEGGGCQTILGMVEMLLAAAGARKHELLLQQDRKGWGVFHHAAAGGHPEVIARLLGFGLGTAQDALEFQDEEGRTPLHLAIQHRRSRNVATLLRLGASPLVPDAFGLFPLDAKM